MALIEQYQEVQLSRNIADVRSWGEKYAEKLSKPEFLAINVAGVIACTLILKMLWIVWVVCFLFLFFTHLSYRVLLPLRYPPDGVDEKGKPGDGIMYVGHLRSTNAFENFREIWMADSDLRTHFLILGSTGSGKSETLKGMFYNALCWGSGFFLADGKADNKMPLDLMAMCRMQGVDDDFLALNFLIGGSSPEKIRASRRRRTNMINTFSDSDADTQIQMGANLLPKAEGDGKSWQEKALNFWRSLVAALCYKRDTEGFEISVGTYIDYMGLPKVEELYAEGYKEYLRTGEWSYGYVGIKSYCESGGCPGFMVDRVIAKYQLPPDPRSADRIGLPNERGPMGRGGPMASAGKPAQKTEQDQSAYDQHGYRIGQLMPALNLLDKTYGHIFRAKYSEIDMVDVALNNRVLVMMIPSLEKSASEAENLGKLAIACLRVMMGRNLGADIEGDRIMVLDSKATEANYPYLVALDELGYYFSDGIAVMFAQARSLGMSMIAAAQDIEKLTEGTRASEAGAMLANAVAKFFMRIDDAQKTQKLISDYVGKARVAVYDQYELNSGGFRRDKAVKVDTLERVTISDMQSMKTGQGVINTRGKTFGVAGFYVGDYLDKHKMKDFRINRFLQVRQVSQEEVVGFSIAADEGNDAFVKGRRMLEILCGKASPDMEIEPDMLISRLEIVAQALPANIAGAERGAALYVAAKKAIQDMFGVLPGVVSGAGSGGDRPHTDASVGSEALPLDHDESVGLPTKGEFASIVKAAPAAAPAASGPADGEAAERTQRRTQAQTDGDGGPTAEPVQAVQEVPAVQAASDDPFAYLDEAIFERRPIEQLAAPATPRAAQAAQPAVQAHGVPPGDPDAFILGTIAQAAEKQEPPQSIQNPGVIDPSKLFDEIDAAPAPETGVGVPPASVLPSTEPRVSSSSLEAPAVLSGEIKAAIAQMLSAGRAVRERNISTHSGNKTNKTGYIVEPSTGAASRPTMGAGQGAGWVANALRGAETTLKRVGPDAVGFDDRTRDTVAAVEAALGSQDPSSAARNTERIVSAQITPIDDEPAPNSAAQESVDDFMAMLGNQSM